MLRVLTGLSTLLLVSLLGCASDVSGGGSPSGGDAGAGGTTGNGTGGAGSSGGSDGGGSSGTTGGGGSGGSASDLTCAEIEVELPKEQAAIMSCTADAQCGQELKGTSCGCTRNLVARLDADTTRFYELLTTSQELQCDDGVGSTCDCPNAEGFVCKNGFCAWNYVP
ncbi:hypothetical protein [Polyangium sorediatum]|uniref:Lipoprotein n=1 Tax=Polyangium sorediatum TaxID=889274 RepID=A0ABT6NXF3_9BACT|nr:hypothetical protein [Polyangium sorediatum]MDI1432812.1 hypothetical protein [Polyangium sorediatum]